MNTKNEKIAVYPGTFDPITHGHIDIIRRASKIFDHLIVGVASDSVKEPLFSIKERVNFIKSATKEIKSNCKISVVEFSGLLINFAKHNNASTIVRGLRVVSDFEYEFQMSNMNYRLCSDVETIFFPASEGCHFIASRLVKEICRLGGDISEFVPEVVKKELERKLGDKK